MKGSGGGTRRFPATAQGLSLSSIRHGMYRCGREAIGESFKWVMSQESKEGGFYAGEADSRKDAILTANNNQFGCLASARKGHIQGFSHFGGKGGRS